MKRGIKTLPKEERPREKLLSRGVKQLSNAELLAILLRTGTKDASALDVAYDIINHSEQGLLSLSEITIDELCEIKGIGRSKACQIVSAIELSNRIVKEKAKILFQVKNPQTISEFFIEEYRYSKVEHFVAVFLDTKNKIIHWEVIFKGSLNQSVVHPREIFKKAIKLSAASIIVVHNHPSGDITPSKEDRLITKRIDESGALVGIPLIDHLIVGNGVYYSFKENCEF